MTTWSEPATRRCVVPNTRATIPGPRTTTSVVFGGAAVLVAVSTCSAVRLTRSSGFVSFFIRASARARVAGASRQGANDRAEEQIEQQRHHDRQQEIARERHRVHERENRQDRDADRTCADGPDGRCRL